MLYRAARHLRPPFSTTAVTAAPRSPCSSIHVAHAGTVHLKLADWTAAAHDFESAIGINSELPVYHYAFSVALERISRRDEAYAPPPPRSTSIQHVVNLLVRYASLRKALELAPDFIPALHELSALQFADNKFSECEATASNLLALRPSEGGFPVIFPNRVTMLQPLFPEHLAWLLLPRDYADSFTLRGQARIAMKTYNAPQYPPFFCALHSDSTAVMMAQYRISASRSLQASKTPKSTTCARFATDASRSLLPQHVAHSFKS